MPPFDGSCSRDAVAQREAAVLAALQRAAAAGSPCPTNDRLCGIIGCSSTATAVRAVTALEKRGVIRVTRYRQGRMVEIVATGQRTAAPTDQPIHFTRQHAAA